MKRLIAMITMAILLLLAVALCVGCGDESRSADSEITITEDGDVSAVDTDDPSDVKAAEMVREMDIETKIAQLFFGESGDAEDFGLSMGGIILFSGELSDRDQVRNLIKNYQKNADIPLFIGVDEEGGRVANLSKNEDLEVTRFPPMKEIGNTGDYTKAGEVGEIQGKELKALGFNVNFAPVADLVKGSSNTEIGDRSFGSDPELVSEMISEYVHCLQSEDVSAVVKHFPGHGSTTANTHEGSSVAEKSLKELWKSDLVPFASVLGAGDESDFVMISHMTAPKIDAAQVPCSLSNKVVSELLRDDIGFYGIAITDSMQMEAVTDNYSSARAAVMAIKAGEDMILMSDDMSSAYEAILQAVKSGEIKESRIDDSVQRILRIKIQRGVIDN